jgi:hypothetical protein
MGVRWRLHAIVLMVLCGGTLTSASAAAADCGGSREKAVVAAALTFVPNAPRLKVRAIEPDLTGAPSDVRSLDAFVVRERDGSLRQVVYLNCESAMFKAAVRGDALQVKLLAGVIFHESCHLRGMDEEQAGAAERGFVADMIQRGVIPTKEGLAYLRLMARASGTR